MFAPTSVQGLRLHTVGHRPETILTRMTEKLSRPVTGVGSDQPSGLENVVDDDGDVGGMQPGAFADVSGDGAADAVGEVG